MLQTTTLSKLISWEWTVGRGTALGVKVTPAEIDTRLTEVNARQLRRKGQLQAYMRATGQTRADLLFRAKVQLFEVKLGARVTALEHAPGLTLAKRRAEITKLLAGEGQEGAWIAKTSCRPGFVAPGCRQYKGTQVSGGE
jgi:hypothetical protein